jgi:hypothetical protein
VREAHAAFAAKRERPSRISSMIGFVKLLGEEYQPTVLREPL